VTDIPYLEHLHQDGRALAEAAQRDLRAQVPSCPEWRVSDLVRHTGEVHRRISEHLRRASVETSERPTIEEPPSGDEGLIAWYEQGLSALEKLFHDLPFDSPAWTWWPPDRSAGFWRRRMALETAVHRWDAENATDVASSIDADLAADGVDEFFDIHVPADEAPYEGAPGTVHVHRTDGEGEWILWLDAGTLPQVSRGHEKGDAAVRSGASDLLLFVWRRRSPREVEVFGDEALVADLWAYWEHPGT
jgi:uncharacterized protein (TIGR03083 family)